MVEFAIVIPFFLLIISATIELCSITFLKETLAVAAYEGGRLAVRRTGSLANTDAKIRDVLSQRGVNLNGESNPITITPDPATAAVLDPITIHICAPLSQNTIVPFSLMRIMNSNSVECQIVMRKESEPIGE